LVQNPKCAGLLDPEFMGYPSHITNTTSIRNKGLHLSFALSRGLLSVKERWVCPVE
jgi:hypothetical protein